MRLDCLSRRAAAAVLLAGLAVGCTGADGPPAITLDRSACGHCGMLVSELRTAGALRVADGTAHVFDDIGCLLSAVRELQQNDGRIWVHDAASSQWVPADSAVFTRRADIWTPMGSGLLAWTEASAPSGEVTLTFEELLQDEPSDARGRTR